MDEIQRRNEKRHKPRDAHAPVGNVVKSERERERQTDSHIDRKCSHKRWSIDATMHIFGHVNQPKEAKKKSKAG